MPSDQAWVAAECGAAFTRVIATWGPRILPRRLSCFPDLECLIFRYLSPENHSSDFTKFGDFPKGDWAHCDRHPPTQPIPATTWMATLHLPEYRIKGVRLLQTGHCEPAYAS